jgi:hypothetical protein
MSNWKRFLLLGLGITLLMATLLFTLSSMRSGTAYAATNPAVTFATANWNCKTAACTTRVTAGTAQPAYECAEFVARALATEGFMPGLTSTSPQSAFDPYYRTGFKHTYDLLLITPTAGLYTLADYLKDEGHATNIGTNLNNASAGDMVVLEDSSGKAHHTVLIVTEGLSTSSTMVDAHNNARLNYALSNYFSEFPKWYILHLPTGAGCAVSSSGGQTPLICAP